MLTRVLIVFIVLLQVYSSKAIEAVVAHKLFYKNEGKGLKPYVEIYWQIAPNSLHFMEPDSGNIYAKIRTDIVFKDEYGIIVKEDHYYMQTNAVTTINMALAQNIIELQNYNLPYGHTKIEFCLQEVIDSSNTYRFTDIFTIKPLADTSAYANLQLLDTLFTSNSANVFNKNGHVQIPLCADFIDEQQHTLFFYTELYNTEKLNANSILTQTYFVSKKPLDNILYKLQYSDTIKPAHVLPVRGKLNIKTLPSGNYYLNLILKNESGIVASASQFFQRVNTKPVRDTNSNNADTGFQTMQVFDLSSSFVGKYTLPQLKAILKMIKPISKPIETQSIDNFIARPDETYMRYFIYNFWKERNPTNPKEAWNKYVEIVKNVNKSFSVSGIQGYETERGIIYLKYGKPDEMISVQNEQGTEPYEIWTYNTLPQQSTGGLLLFYRPGFMLSDYRLLHSNVKGEQRNSNWRSLLYKNGKPNNAMNSRAEQYLSGIR